MKLQFSAQELAWLYDKVNKLLYIAGNPSQPNPKLASVAAKMRYKFTPNAHTTYLTQKEASVLFALVEARSESVENVTEAQTMASIARKLTQEAG